jgi:hypothetical protein
MVEKLCSPSDDDHNEHKKLQLRELAALNGTLKEVSECYLCGMEGHTPEMCPNKVGTVVVCGGDACSCVGGGGLSECCLCGMERHTPEMCPNKVGTVVVCGCLQLFLLGPQH